MCGIKILETDNEIRKGLEEDIEDCERQSLNEFSDNVDDAKPICNDEQFKKIK